MNAVNPVLAFLVVLLACGAIVTRLSPQVMRALAARLRATADASDARKDCFERKREQYRQEMGLDEKPEPLAMRERWGR